MYKNFRSRYVIVFNNNTVISGITMDGTPVISYSNNIDFDTHDAAAEYLRHSARCSIDANLPNFRYNIYDNYKVEVTKIDYFETCPVLPVFETIWNVFKDENAVLSYKIPDDARRSPQATALRLAVTEGFKLLCRDKKTVLEILHSSKYEDIVKAVVPPHMIANLDNFWEVGIRDCDETELGAIMLTSDEDLLKYISIDRYNISG